MSKNANEELEKMAASMSEEEMRARIEALEQGRMDIVETALSALIVTSPHSELIEGAIAERLASLKNEKWPQDHPDASWAPETIYAGAIRAAERILWLYERRKAARPVSPGH